MAHFDLNGNIEPHVLFYIEKLSEEGFDIVLISTSPSLNKTDIDKALKYCRGIIQRKNIGHDFGSWKTGIDFIENIWNYDRILITNDSVFGPFSPLDSVFKKFEDSKAIVCSLTDCRQIDYHLQSYFLYFKKAIFKNQEFKDFWGNMKIKHVKMEIVREYEIGFSNALISAGIDLFVLCRYDEILKYTLDSISEFQYKDVIEEHPLNPCLHLWDILLEKYNFPFIKTEILKHNRLESRSFLKWHSLVPKSAGKLVSLIENYIKRVKPNLKSFETF